MTPRELMEAIKVGDTQLAVLGMMNLDLTHTDEEGNSCLHCAVLQTDVEVMKHLIRAGIDLDLPNKEGNSPLHLCAHNGHKECTNLLLKAGAKVDPKDKRDRTPYYWAYKRYHIGVEELLLRYGASYIRAGDRGVFDDTPSADNNRSSVVYVLAQKEETELVLKMVENEKGLNLNWKGYRGRTVLHWAAVNSNYEIVKCFVDHGADVNAQDNLAMTALHEACYWGNKQNACSITNYLLDAGADINAMDDAGNVPLVYALSFNGPTVADILVGRQADILRADKHAQTPLLYASKFEHHSDIHFRMLRNLGVNVRFPGQVNNWSFLHRFARNEFSVNLEIESCEEIDDYLRSMHQEIHPDDMSNERIASMAMAKSDPADVNQPDKFGLTPLHHAARGRSRHRDDNLWSNEMFFMFKFYSSIKPLSTGKILPKLLKTSTNCIALDNNGWTPWFTAKKFGLEKEQKYLEEEMAKRGVTDPEMRPSGIETWNEIMENSNEQLCDLLDPGSGRAKPAVEMVRELLLTPGLGLIFTLNSASELIMKQIKVLFQRLTSKLNQHQPCLGFSVVYGGSVGEGTKMGLPDEFDVRVYMDKLGDACVVEDGSYLESIKLKIKSSHKDYLSKFSRKGYLDPSKLNHHLHKSVYQALSQDDTWDGLDFYWKPFGKSEINMEWMGSSCHGLPVKIDTVFCIWIPEIWPGSKDTEPDEKGFSAILRTNYWKMCPCEFEMATMQELPTAPKFAFILCKLINMMTDYQESKFYIKSYEIKNAFLYMMHDESESTSSSSSTASLSTYDATRSDLTDDLMEKVIYYTLRLVDKGFHYMLAKNAFFYGFRQWLFDDKDKKAKREGLDRFILTVKDLLDP